MELPVSRTLDVSKEEVLKMVDRMAIKMILSIEAAIMKYIKDST